MSKRILAGGVVVNGNKQVAVVNQNNDSWSLPKGMVEEGESKLEAAQREIYEETGIKPHKLKLIKELGSYKRTRIAKGGVGEVKGELREIYMFLFKTSQKKLRPIDPENPEARWIEIDRVSRLLTHKKDREFFERVKNKVIC